MSNSGCFYDCSQYPEELTPNPDISGIGIALANTITAGFAVLIVIVYFICAYQPHEDPFGRSAGDNDTGVRTNFKANGLDVGILQIFRKWKYRRSTFVDGASRPQSRMHTAITKCMLILSDLQLLTGLSILISGYSQLRCGLTVYHYTKLVNMAWFSSITHLASLTFLRRHLYQYKFKRLWRVFAMGSLVVLLILALIPIGISFPGISGETASDYAICFISHPDRHRNVMSKHGAWPELIERVQQSGIQHMVISVLLLGLGMLNRMIRLHSKPTHLLYAIKESGRKKLSKALCHIEQYCENVSYFPRLGSSFLFIPLLSTFVVMRTLVDLLSSMVFENWWLLASFSWGAVQLWRKSDYWDEVQAGQTDEWTFGQVIQLISVAAPLIMLLEELSIGTDSSRSPPEVIVLNTNSTPNITTSTALAVPSDTVDYDYYHSPWICAYIIILLLDLLGASFLTFFYLFYNTELSDILLPLKYKWNWIPLSIISNLFFCAMFSLFIEKYNCGTKVQIRVVFVLRIGIYLGLIILFLIIPIYFAVLNMFSGWYPLLGSYAMCGYGALYVILAVLDELWLKKWSKR